MIFINKLLIINTMRKLLILLLILVTCKSSEGQTIAKISNTLTTIVDEVIQTEDVIKLIKLRKQIIGQLHNVDSLNTDGKMSSDNYNQIKDSYNKLYSSYDAFSNSLQGDFTSLTTLGKYNPQSLSNWVTNTGGSYELSMKEIQGHYRLFNSKYNQAIASTKGIGDIVTLVGLGVKLVGIIGNAIKTHKLKSQLIDGTFLSFTNGIISSKIALPIWDDVVSQYSGIEIPGARPSSPETIDSIITLRRATNIPAKFSLAAGNIAFPILANGAYSEENTLHFSDKTSTKAIVISKGQLSEKAYYFSSNNSIPANTQFQIKINTPNPVYTFAYDERINKWEILFPYTNVIATAFSIKTTPSVEKGIICTTAIEYKDETNGTLTIPSVNSNGEQNYLTLVGNPKTDKFIVVVAKKILTESQQNSITDLLALGNSVFDAFSKVIGPENISIPGNNNGVGVKSSTDDVLSFDLNNSSKDFLPILFEINRK